MTNIESRMKILSGIAGLAALAITAGCDMQYPSAEAEITLEKQMNRTETKTVAVESPAKYEVKRVAVFEDDLAYGYKRGIYEIKDKETGKTYVGISGIGITERGSHMAGKIPTGDER